MAHMPPQNPHYLPTAAHGTQNSKQSIEGEEARLVGRATSHRGLALQIWFACLRFREEGLGQRLCAHRP